MRTINAGEATVLLRMVSILASAVRRVREDEHIADEIAARVERATMALRERGPNGYDEADDELRACERLLGEGS